MMALYLMGDVIVPSPGLGIPEASGTIQWLLPSSRLLWRLLSVLTVGLLLAAAALLPSGTKRLSRTARRATLMATASSLFAGCTAAFFVVGSYANALAVPMATSLDPKALWGYVLDSPQGTAWALSAVLALMAGSIAASARTSTRTWLGLALAMVSILPPAAVGHAASSGNHDLATSALLLHVASSALWAGGVVALVWVVGQGREDLMVAAGRFSALALPLYVAVGVSGLANAFYRSDDLDQFAGTTYGALVAAKALMFLGLGILGYTHRRASLRQLSSGSTVAFRRLIVVEASLLIVTLGISSTLSATPPPARSGDPVSPAEVLLGFTIPPAPSVPSIVTSWRVDILIASLLVAGAAYYCLGVFRLRRRGDSWPIGRSVAWIGGLAVIGLATLSGLSAYGRVSFSLHMVQHMTLSMIAPLMLSLGAPVTLALRALPPARNGSIAGPREWLLSALHSRPVRVVTHPLAALALFITAPYMVYFSGLFEFAMQNHWAHLLMQVHFVAVGYLFYQTLIGIDPLPYRFPYPFRLMSLMIALASHSFFAIALMSSDVVIAASYFDLLERPWWPDLLREQTGGASFAWAFGEIPGVMVMIGLLLRWSRDDDQRARQIDRAADRDADAELGAYNAMLAARSRRTARGSKL